MRYCLNVWNWNFIRMTLERNFLSHSYWTILHIVTTFSAQTGPFSNCVEFQENSNKNGERTVDKSEYAHPHAFAHFACTQHLYCEKGRGWQRAWLRHSLLGGGPSQGKGPGLASLSRALEVERCSRSRLFADTVALPRASSWGSFKKKWRC